MVSFRGDLSCVFVDLRHSQGRKVGVNLVFYAAVFRLVTCVRLFRGEERPGGALRDEPKNGCVGD